VHRLGIDKLAVTGRALGLGQIFDCGLAGLKQGIMPDTAWKRATLDQPWYPGETISCGIGQGYVSATPLQLAVVVARIASGKSIVPSFICSHANETQVPASPLPYKPDISATGQGRDERGSQRGRRHGDALGSQHSRQC
jgi:penicillin-binding protein 2